MRDGDTQFLYTELCNWGMEDPDITLTSRVVMEDSI